VKLSELKQQAALHYLTTLVESLEPLPYKLARENSKELLYLFEYNTIQFFVDVQVLKSQPGFPLSAGIVTFYEAPNTSTGQLSFEQTHKHKYSGNLFGTVGAILSNSVMHKLDAISFVGEGSRVGLYTSLAKKFSKGNNIYKYETSEGGLWIISKIPLNEESQTLLAHSAEQIIANKV